MIFLFAISHLGPLKIIRKIALDNLEIWADPRLKKYCSVSWRMLPFTVPV
jgi:hypothetical protein